MLAFILSPIGKSLGGALVVIVALYGLYQYGKSVGRADLVQELQEDKAEIIKDGKRVDEKVYGSDDAALCILLGGCLSDQAKPDEPVRRIGPNRPEAGNQ